MIPSMVLFVLLSTCIASSFGNVDILKVKLCFKSIPRANFKPISGNSLSLERILPERSVQLIWNVPVKPSFMLSYSLFCDYAKSGLVENSIRELQIEQEMSAEVEEEFAGNAAQDELKKLREAYDSSHPENETLIYVPTEIDFNANQSDLFEGDIILTPEQWKVALDYDPEDPARRRQGITTVADLWQPIGAPIIPYEFLAGFPEAHKQVVLDAMKYWEERTCIKFRKATPSDTIGVIFNHKSTGCSSVVGCMSYDRQNLNLSPNGCMTVTIVAHELSHTFGTLHVQSRSDRTFYVTIDTANIQKGHEHNFKMEPKGYSTYGIPYEFGSMQHYFPHSFAIDKTRPTIYARPKFQQYQGSMDGPRATFWDTELINRMYKCTDKCAKPVACQNNGVQHANDCNKCFCPRGWSGTYCEKRPAEAQIFNAGATTTNVIMELKGAFSGFQEKLVIVQAPAGKRIKATVATFGPYNFSMCRSVGLEVIPFNDTRSSGFRFCAKPNTAENTFTSEGNTMLLWMFRDANYDVASAISVQAV